MYKFIKKNIFKIFMVIFFIIFSLLYLKVKIVREIVGILIVSFVLAYALRPIHKCITSRFKKLNKRFVALILVLLVIVICLLILIILIPSLLNEGLNIDGLLNTGEDIKNWLSTNIKSSRYDFINNISQNIWNKLNSVFLKCVDSSVDSLISFSENILSLAVIPVVTYYFLADNKLIINKFYFLFPMKRRMIVKKITEDIDAILGKYILSQFFLCGIIGVCTFITLFFLNVKYKLILSLLNALVNIIPYFGPIFGAVPAIFIALIDSPYKAMYTAIAFFIIQQIEGNILSPMVTSNSIRMHTLIVIILLLIGDKLGGFIGMILAVPVGVIIKVIYEDINYYTF